ncbi:MAG: methyltransferase domain-containing protein [Candidatus Pacebacteria bacterium]|nr:methyltransferase domain-containing protein [Candidatus Paceibacterota bacterium]
MTTESQQKDNKEDIDLENLSNVWDDYAKYYDKLAVIPFFKDTRKKLLKTILPCPGGIIHDGGCGTGYYLKDILEKTQASKIIATDISSEMIKKAKERVSKMPKEYQNKIEFYQMDLTKEWPPGEFDAQIFLLLTNYLPDENWKKIIKLSYKTTKDGGYVYSGSGIKGLTMKTASLKYFISEALTVPISVIPFGVKAAKFVSMFDKLEEDGKIVLPTNDEYLDYHKEVGFKKIELVDKFIWGKGIMVRAQK